MELEERKISKEEINIIIEEIKSLKKDFKDFIKKVISCEDLFCTIVTIVECFIIMKITSLIEDKYIFLVTINVILLYAPIEKHCSHFLFKIRMSFTQIIEGVIGLLECLIPRYEDPNEKNKIN